MTEEEFRRSWLRESGPQPGVFLDVQEITGLTLSKNAA